MTDKNQDIHQLNSFLRGELSAVETYKQCIAEMKDPVVSIKLEALKRSHEKRADLLAARIRRLGGTPSEDSGLWGSFAKVVQAGATAVGKSAAVAALEEGEDHGRDDYKRDLPKLSHEERLFVESQIVPEQQRTHDTLSQIEANLS